MSLGIIFLTALAITVVVVSAKVKKHSKRIKELEDLTGQSGGKK